METYATALSIAIPSFFVLVAIEHLISRLMKKEINRSLDMISSLSSGLTNTLKALVGLSVIIISYEYMVAHLAVYTIQSTFLVYLAAFIGLDFAGYWEHRFNHKINLFWNRHIIHHSSEEFNLSCALRQTISSIVVIYFFLYIPMAIVGIPAKVIALIAPIHLFAQFWYHTRLINKMGFLEHILVTPSHHRVHHAINDQYLDKNFAQIFIVWDKWFGTFQEELADEPAVYGVKKPVNTWNPFLINFMHVWGIAKDAWRTEKLWDKLRIWFMPTGWRPQDVQKKYPIEIITNPHERVKYETHASLPFKIWCWSQFLITLLLMYYLLVSIADIQFTEVLLYSGFLAVSIFAYTTLMDKHFLAIPMELIKMGFGFFLIYQLGGWFGLEQIIPGASYIITSYMILSMVLTLYFYKTEQTQPTSGLSVIQN